MDPTLEYAFLEQQNSFPDVQWVKNLPAVQETQRWGFDPWVRNIPWRRKWQFTPVFLPEKSHGQRILTGQNPKGRKELETTEQLSSKQPGASNCPKKAR